MNNNSRRYMDFAPKRGGGSGGGRSIVVREEERRVVATRVSGPRPIKVRSKTQISVRSLDDKSRMVLMPKKEVKIPVPTAPRRRVNDMVVPRGQMKSVMVETRREQKSVPKKKMPVTAHRVEPILSAKPEKKSMKPVKVEREEVNVFDEFPAPLDTDALDFGDEEDEGDDYWDRDLGVIEDIDPISDKEIAERADVVVATNEMGNRRSDIQGKGKKQRLEDNRVGFKEGKSPFINTDKLEKRPLSAFRRGNNRPMPVKNSYAEQVKAAEEKSDVPTMVVTGTGKRSGFSLVIAIIMVTILGAAAGFVMYLAFFQ